VRLNNSLLLQYS